MSNPGNSWQDPMGLFFFLLWADSHLLAIVHLRRLAGLGRPLGRLRLPVRPRGRLLGPRFTHGLTLLLPRADGGLFGPDGYSLALFWL